MTWEGRGLTAEERLAAREPVDEGALGGVDPTREALARPQRLDRLGLGLAISPSPSPSPGPGPSPSPSPNPNPNPNPYQVQTYLLEKSRVISFSEQERNSHP